MRTRSSFAISFSILQELSSDDGRRFALGVSDQIAEISRARLPVKVLSPSYRGVAAGRGRRVRAVYRSHHRMGRNHLCPRRGSQAA
jgi:hypothetical protein